MSRPIAVITDIHGNVPALEAALDRIEELDVDEAYCGGDLVGYGPRPNEICRTCSRSGPQHVRTDRTGRRLRHPPLRPYAQTLGPRVRRRPFRQLRLGGKPKDGDPRGSFALLEEQDGDVNVSIERVAYDAQAVATEIRNAGLPYELADQLVRAE